MIDVYQEPIEEKGVEKIEKISGAPAPEKIEKRLPVEEEISALERRLAEKKKELERVKKLEGVVEKIGEKAGPAAPPVVLREEELTEEEKLSLKKIKILPRKKQLESLIEIALWRGLGQSIKIAKALNNAYILDAFHDNLIDKLYKELIKQGKIKEE